MDLSNLSKQIQQNKGLGCEDMEELRAETNASRSPRGPQANDATDEPAARADMIGPVLASQPKGKPPAGQASQDEEPRGSWTRVMHQYDAMRVRIYGAG